MRLVALPGGIGQLEDDGSVAELDVPHPSLHAFLADGGSLRSLATASVRRRIVGPDAVSARPLTWAGAVWGIGMNYSSKQRVTGRSLPEHPMLFVKAAASLQPGGGAVALPAAAPTQVDYEGEIAVVIGEDLFEASARAAASGVAMVTAADDLTARDVLRDLGNPTLAKGFPGFGQLSNVFVDPETLGGLEGIPLATEVGSEVRQRDTSDGMLMSIGEVVAFLSRFVALRPGDIVLTGTPAGTGDEVGVYLAHGDTVAVNVAGLPPLVTRIVQNGVVR
jgi:2-keto-4-pentenoate hydratase/2-oxohepta-3-ene-1,7-dioic acid hydratase in catechol pathway